LFGLCCCDVASMLGTCVGFE